MVQLALNAQAGRFVERGPRVLLTRVLGWLVVGWVGRQAMPAVLAFGRVLRPAWQPAMAYFGRGKAAAPAAPPRRDPWAEAMREKLDEAKAEEREP